MAEELSGGFDYRGFESIGVTKDWRLQVPPWARGV